jgi:cytochrome b involved in lipid metabolism
MESEDTMERIIITIDDKRYDLTNFSHPGGMAKLSKHNNTDGTDVFLKVHKKDFPHDKMIKYLIN